MDINIKEIDLKQEQGRDNKEEQNLPLIRQKNGGSMSSGQRRWFRTLISLSSVNQLQ
jgi:hypothetical protein